MKGEPLSIDELLERPPALPRSSIPPRRADSDAPTGRYRIVPSKAIRRSARPSRRPSSAPRRASHGLGTYAAMAAWGCALIGLGFFAAAQPPTSFAFFDLFGGSVRTYWDSGHLGVALTLGGIAWSLSAAGMVFDALRANAQLNRGAASALVVASGLAAGCVYFL